MMQTQSTWLPRNLSHFWRRLRALTIKEFRQLIRDKSNLAIGIFLPIALILLFGYGLSLDIRNAPVAIVLEDGAPMARDVVAGLRGSDYIAPRYVTTMAEAEALMRGRQVDGIVRIPSDFSRQLAQGRGTVQLVVHGTDAATAASLRGYVSAAIDGWNKRRADSAGRVSAAPGVELVDRLWFNSANSSTWYLVPGLIVLIMTLVGGFLTSMVIAREWERGTMEALFVTPVRSLEILLAKIIPYFAVGMGGADALPGRRPGVVPCAASRFALGADGQFNALSDGRTESGVVDFSGRPQSVSCKPGRRHHYLPAGPDALRLPV